MAKTPRIVGEHEMKSQLRFEIKEISEDGSFEGLLSPYGNIDEGGDLVEPGAYTKTLKDRGSKIPMLWQHDAKCPIGDLTLEDRKDGLWCKGQLLMELPEAKKAHLLLKAKIVKGLSIGFKTIKDSIDNGVRRLKEIRLYEGSVVTFPMNEMALITSVKSQSEVKGDFNEELGEIQTLQAYYQMISALQNALSTLIWNSDLERDEKIIAAGIILQQFAEAFSAFFPDYLDVLAEVWGPSETWSDSNRENKAGAEFSSGNMDKIKAACEMIKSGHDTLLALLEGKAAFRTLSTKAASPKPEPAEDHSAESSLISTMRSLIPA